MNLRTYFQKIHETEGQISGDHTVVVSNETPDGGKAGVKTEVPKRVAAKMVVDGAARLASEDEAAEFRSAQAQAAEEAKKRTMAAQIRFAVVPAAEVEGSGATKV
ncbi:MAG TPA: hypothetical protein VKX45_18630 [Bryobacteraceae bacterium]|jgi:hypothetical protein|nr:hypothetical protein [Bryobacteraceae bacterium]